MIGGEGGQRIGMAKILVIDDDRSICESLELYLSEEGYEVHTAGTGTDGLNKFV